MSDTRDITQVLAQVNAGDAAAKEQLFELAYSELHQLATRLMRGERGAHTLQPTALVNEAALRLCQGRELENAASRALFFWTMARAMRQVLVDHARRRAAQRRGGGEAHVPIQSADEVIGDEGGIDLIALDEALEDLELLDARQHQVVVLRFFGGFEMKEIAEQLNVSLSTVEKDWRIARAWLRTKLA